MILLFTTISPRYCVPRVNATEDRCPLAGRLFHPRDLLQATATPVGTAEVYPADREQTSRGNRRTGAARLVGTTPIAASSLSAVKAKTDLIAAGDIKLILPITNNGTQLTLVAGDDYYHAHGRAIELTSSDFPDLAGATCGLRIISRDTNTVVFTVDGTIVDPQTLRFEIPREKTSLLAPAAIGTYVFAARIVFSDEQIATEIRGQVLVLNG